MCASSLIPYLLIQKTTTIEELRAFTVFDVNLASLAAALSAPQINEAKMSRKADAEAPRQHTIYTPPHFSPLLIYNPAHSLHFCTLQNVCQCCQNIIRICSYHRLRPFIAHAGHRFKPRIALCQRWKRSVIFGGKTRIAEVTDTVNSMKGKISDTLMDSLKRIASEVLS